MENLKILQKTYDMIKYGNSALMQYPKSEKYLLVSDIKRCMYHMLELIIRANKSRSKKALLFEIDVELDVLRTFLRLSADKDVKYLPLRKYEYWCKQLNEIGRMLGGWIKSAS